MILKAYQKKKKRETFNKNKQINNSEPGNSYARHGTNPKIKLFCLSLLLTWLSLERVGVCPAVRKLQSGFS